MEQMQSPSTRHVKQKITDASFAKSRQGGIPGPPMLPVGCTKTDIYDINSNDSKVFMRSHEQRKLDKVGQAIIKTIPNAVVDDSFCNFFNASNLDKLQVMIAEQVATNGYTIERQNDSQLLILMRNVFLSQPGSAQDVLNAIVTKDASRNIISNIKFSNIHLDMKRSSFNPLSYGISDVGSIRGT